MSKPPQPPHAKAARRTAYANALAATTLWTVTVLLIVFPFALAGIWGVREDIAGPTGIVTWSTAAFSGYFATLVTTAAWQAYDRYRRHIDEAEWDEYQAEQRRMEKILREEGLA